MYDLPRSARIVQRIANNMCTIRSPRLYRNENGKSEISSSFGRRRAVCDAELLLAETTSFTQIHVHYTTFSSHHFSLVFCFETKQQLDERKQRERME